MCMRERPSPQFVKEGRSRYDCASSESAWMSLRNATTTATAAATAVAMRSICASFSRLASTFFGTGIVGYRSVRLKNSTLRFQALSAALRS